jgi:hypothetical protein
MIIIYDYLEHTLKLRAFLSRNWEVQIHQSTIIAGRAKQPSMEDERPFASSSTIYAK